MPQSTTILMHLTESMSRTRKRFEEHRPNPLAQRHTFYLRNEVWTALGQPKTIVLAIAPHPEGGDSQ